MVGQRVRNYTITSESSPSSSDGGVGGAASTVLVSGDAIGTKRIHLLPAPITVQQDTTIRLLVTHAVATPQIKSFVRPAPMRSQHPELARVGKTVFGRPCHCLLAMDAGLWLVGTASSRR